VRFRAVQRLASCHAVRRICRALGVSPSGYYAWKAGGETARAREDRLLKQRIVAIHGETRGRYGTPRVERELRRQGVHTSRKRVGRLRRELGLRARAARRYRATTDSSHQRPVAPNLLDRQFEAAEPDRVWVSDITYLATEEGWLYLSVVLDVCSRRVVGWAVADSLDQELAVSALDQAIAARRPAPGLIFHSDRGSQYCGQDFQRRIEEAGILPSMSRKGDCWDNAMAESFFKTLKVELGRRFKTRIQGRRELFEYIEGFYNTRRLHSGLGYLSPSEYERLQLQEQAA
jgi:putative transposase